MEFSELNPEEIERATNMIKAISHPMRLAILGYLGEEGKHLILQVKGKWPNPSDYDTEPNPSPLRIELVHLGSFFLPVHKLMSSTP